MAPARKSRKLGFGEGPGGGGKRVSDSASDSSEEKKLYVLVWHDLSDDYDYSLFALGIPSPGTIVKTRPTVFTTPMVKVRGVEPNIPPKTEPERSPVLPLLRFGHQERWPRSMRCIRLAEKLYFLGGYHDDEEEEPTQVYVLDLSKEIKPRDRDRAKIVLEPAAPMNSGKGDAIVSFVSDGKIFLVSGRVKKGAVQFEIFNPSVGDKGVWNKDDLRQPPFRDAYLHRPLVVDNIVFFCGGSRVGNFTCCYRIDTGIWYDYCVTRPDGFDYCPRIVMEDDEEMTPDGFYYCSRRDMEEEDMRPDGFDYCSRRDMEEEENHRGFGGVHFSCEELELMCGGVAVGETLWNVFVDPETHVPAVVRLNINIGKKRKVKKKLFTSGLRYYIQHPVDANDFFYPPPGTLLTRAAPQDSRLCFLQVESCDGLDVRQIRMSAILFDVNPRGRSSPPKYLTSAHYFVKLDPSRRPYDLIDAHLVSPSSSSYLPTYLN